MKLGLLPLRTPKKLFVIGDVHGEKFKLRKLLGYIARKIKPEDHVVFCGDLVDAGPDSPGVLLDIISFKNGHANTYIVRGNHEIMMLKAIFRPSQDDWYKTTPDRVYNMGHQLKKYGVGATRVDFMKWMESSGALELMSQSLPYYETDKVIVTHAPIDQKIIDDKALEPHEGLLDKIQEDITWGFQPKEDAEVEGVDKLLICGHQNNWGKSSSPRHYERNKRLFLDTGSGYHKANPLACVEIEEDGSMQTILARNDD